LVLSTADTIAAQTPHLLILPAACDSLIYRSRAIGDSVKFLYCPKCKELRVRPWYSGRNQCSRCRGAARPIDIPKSAFTYATYVLMTAVFLLVYLNTTTDYDIYLFAAVAGVIAIVVLQFVEISRGELYAKMKIRPTSSDLQEFRKRGWR
jgi:hypothetical protein